MFHFIYYRITKSKEEYLMSEKVLQLFSGGKDSFLSTCKLAEQGYTVLLITYKNGCSLCIQNTKHEVERLIKKYGEKVHFLGYYPTVGIWREFFLPFLNLKPSEIKEKYGEITYSQFNCLTCRTTMYLYSIVFCNYLGIKKISDGARPSQGFVVELPSMLERYEKLLSKYEIELLLPVQYIDSDWTVKNELLLRGIVPKTLEPQCLIGVPLPNGKKPDEDIIQGTLKFFDEEMYPKCYELLCTIEKVINI